MMTGYVYRVFDVLERMATLDGPVSEVSCFSGCLDFSLDGFWFYPDKPSAEKEAV